MLSHYQLYFGSQATLNCFWPKLGQKCQNGQFLAKSTSISGNTALTTSHFRFLYQMLPEYTFGAKFLGILAFSENIWLKSHINIWPAHYFTTSVSCWYLSQPKLNLSSVTHRPPKRTHLQEVHRWISAHHFRFLLARLPESGI